jgi:hypothetical protein
MNAKDPKPSQELHSREALAPVFADLNQYAATMHFLGQTTILTLTATEAQGKLIACPITSRLAGEKRRLMIAALRYTDTFREDERRVAICGAPAVRRLDRRAPTLMTANDQAGSTGQKRLVIVGASGMVGGYALRYALENPAVGSVTAIGRKKLGISHPNLKEVLHVDFADCSALAETLSGQDAVVFCLGTYTGAVSDAELRTITVDYTIEFARVLHGSSPDVAFSFLSGNGADQRNAVAFPTLATRERRRRHYLRRGFRAFTSSGPRTSIPWSRGRNLISATACSARCIRCFECCSPTR